MSEGQVNSCPNADGNPVEVKNDLLEKSDEKPQEELQAPIVNAGDNNAQPSMDANANTQESAEANNNVSTPVPQLQEKVLELDTERDDFRKKLEDTECRLAVLQASCQNGILSNGTPENLELRRELESLKTNLNQTQSVLIDRERQVANQDEQISALNKQVSSLKEVVAITKEMLSIRNMEVKHLQEDVDKMEAKIAAERERHSIMINKMDAAVRLNADLKKEYQTQLQLFQDLRGKYEEKVTLLSEENKALESAVQAQPAQ